MSVVDATKSAVECADKMKEAADKLKQAINGKDSFGVRDALRTLKAAFDDVGAQLISAGYDIPTHLRL